MTLFAVRSPLVEVRQGLWDSADRANAPHQFENIPYSESVIVEWMRCRGIPRSARAFEGAALGALAGLMAGVVTAGVLAAVDRGQNPKMPWLVGLGIFGVAIAGNAISEAIPPEC